MSLEAAVAAKMRSCERGNAGRDKVSSMHCPASTLFSDNFFGDLTGIQRTKKTVEHVQTQPQYHMAECRIIRS